MEPEQLRYALLSSIWRGVQIYPRAHEPSGEEQPREHEQGVKRRDAKTQRADDDGGEPERGNPAWQRTRDPGAKCKHTQTEREDDRRERVQRERRAEQVVDDEQPSAQHSQQDSKRSPAISPLTLDRLTSGLAGSYLQPKGCTHRLPLGLQALRWYWKAGCTRRALHR